MSVDGDDLTDVVSHALARRKFVQACDRLRLTRTRAPEAARKLHLENLRHRLPGHGIV